MSQRNGLKSYSNVEWEQSVGYMKPHLEVLKGQPIYSLLDIGAAQGHFSMMFEDVFNTDTITMIEANPESCELLDKLDWQVINKPVGKPGKATFFINPNEPIGGGSSFYKEDTEWFENAEEYEMDISSLDDLDVWADFVKIDVQGAELDVLTHGTKTLEKAKFLLMELSFVEYNSGAPLIDEVLAKTRELGFVMLDTFGPDRGGHWYKGKRVQVDVLFGREPFKMV